ncbi:MAG: hypothetical protein QXD48_03680 [Candidatus Aenigmatarchaeota archaeon]
MSPCKYCEAYARYLEAYERWVKNAYSFGNIGNPTSEAYKLTPTFLANGGIQYTDEYGHGQFKIFYHANGAPIITASSRELIQVINGRSEIDRLLTRIKDGNFFND